MAAGREPSGTGTMQSMSHLRSRTRSASLRPSESWNWYLHTRTK